MRFFTLICMFAIVLISAKHQGDENPHEELLRKIGANAFGKADDFFLACSEQRIDFVEMRSELREILDCKEENSNDLLQLYLAALGRKYFHCETMEFQKSVERIESSNFSIVHDNDDVWQVKLKKTKRQLDVKVSPKKRPLLLVIAKNGEVKEVDIFKSDVTGVVVFQNGKVHSLDMVNSRSFWFTPSRPNQLLPK